MSRRRSLGLGTALTLLVAAAVATATVSSSSASPSRAQAQSDDKAPRFVAGAVPSDLALVVDEALDQRRHVVAYERTDGERGSTAVTVISQLMSDEELASAASVRNGERFSVRGKIGYIFTGPNDVRVSWSERDGVVLTVAARNLPSGDVRDVAESLREE